MSDEEMRESHTGGLKGQKLAQFSQIPPEIEAQFAEIWALGGQKYGRGNWMLGYDWDLNYDAARRHLGAFWAGEDLNKKDFPDHDVKHVLQAAWHCFVLAWFMENRREFDTRPNVPGETVLDASGPDIKVQVDRLTHAEGGHQWTDREGWRLQYSRDWGWEVKAPGDNSLWEEASESAPVDYGPYTRVES